jgi:hypothetical protein
VRTAALIASVALAIKEDYCLSIESFAAGPGASVSFIHTILHQDLGLEKSLPMDTQISLD